MATPLNFGAAGGGPYDAECTAAREACGEGAGVVLIVRNGKHGDGFEVQLLDPLDVRALPHALRGMAAAVEELILSQPIELFERTPS